MVETSAGGIARNTPGPVVTDAGEGVQGRVAPRFEPVRNAFADNFERRGEVGAGVCVYVAGREVVNLWGGVADETTGRPWREDTLITVHSVTKMATSICAHLLADVFVNRKVDHLIAELLTFSSFGPDT